MGLDKIYDRLMLLTEEAEKFNKAFSVQLKLAAFTLAGYVMAMNDLNGGCDCHDED
jgi:hypothetical protein|tara:strand:- start:520 stop:687 length:168 start_codon:yes stop_codon:yes gene_type:complete